MNLTRRQVLASFGAAGLLALWPASRSFANSPSDTRLLVVFLRRKILFANSADKAITFPVIN